MPLPIKVTQKQTKNKVCKYCNKIIISRRLCYTIILCQTHIISKPIIFCKDIIFSKTNWRIIVF